MHQTRSELSTKIPVSRKGTKYIARALSHTDSSVPAVIALRDMLHLASTAREVKLMIKQKLIKINGKIVTDYRECIKLFNILEAGKSYRLTLLPTGKFSLEETKDKDRLCKVISKKLINGGKIQINLHDGTNLVSKDKINVEDSLYIDPECKIKSHISFDKAKKAFIFSGKYIGQEGKIEKVEGKNVLIKINDKETMLHAGQMVAI